MASWEEPDLPVMPQEEWFPRFMSGSEPDWQKGSLSPRNLFISDTNRDYFPYSCQVCRRSTVCGIELMHCGKCKRVYYCSRDHQMADWKKHKKLCNYAQKIPLSAEPFESAGDYWEKLKKEMSTITAFSMMEGKVSPLKDGLGLKPWILQPHCLCCHVQTNLVKCSLCSGVAHCQREACINYCRVEHKGKAPCEAYRLRLASYVMALQQGNYLCIASKSRLKSPAVEVLSEPTSSSLDNMRVVQDPRKFPSSWSEYMLAKGSDFEVHPVLLSMSPVMAQVTDSLSLTMTVANGLHYFSSSSSALRDASAVSIHLVGVETAELCTVHCYEEVLHWFPNIRNLHIAMIGPQSRDRGGPDLGQNAKFQEGILCRACVDQGCSLYTTGSTKCYHEAVEAKEISDCPDLVVCPHSGLHDGGITESFSLEDGRVVTLQEAWAPTVLKLYAMGVPVIFTAWNAQESLDDAAQIIRVLRAAADTLTNNSSSTGTGTGSLDLGALSDAEVRTRLFPIAPGTRNPFRGLFPMPEGTGRDHDFYYSQNYYMMMHNIVT